MENIIFKLYRSISPSMLEAAIPLINLVRRIKSKPPIPKEEKLAKIDYPNLGDKVIMLHGVSVGEVMSLENLVKKIKTEFPDHKLVITTGTVTGQELANKKYVGYADFITYFPLDTYKTVEKFLSSIKPSVILIAETELWPNFSYCANQKNIPLYVINGRISDKSYPSYRWLKWFFKHVFACYSGIFTQSELDKERFIALGADNEKTKVSKNLKFEIKSKPCDIDLKKGNSKVFIAGSTHKKEDEIALRAYAKLKEKIPNLKFILAPRHMTRFDDIQRMLLQTDFKYGFRTKNADFEINDVVILDTLGELSKLYSIADVAFIGGSFNKTGGHNPLEAVIYSKPVVSGPSIKNFRDIYAILTRSESAFVVKNEKEFQEILEKLFLYEDFYKKTTANCTECFSDQQGALEFIINELKEVLS